MERLKSPLLKGPEKFVRGALRLVNIDVLEELPLPIIPIKAGINGVVLASIYRTFEKVQDQAADTHPTTALPWLAVVASASLLIEILLIRPMAAPDDFNSGSQQ